MIILGGSKGIVFADLASDEPLLLLLSENTTLPRPLRIERAFRMGPQVEFIEGFALYVIIEGELNLASIPNDTPSVILPNSYSYLADGDIVRFVPKKNAVRVLFRKNSHSNAFLLTERCNNYCLMCSQPPKDINDSWIVNEVLKTIPLIDQNTREIGFTGGEPTLLGDDLIQILTACESWLPRTTVHVLSNGRRFSDEDFARKYAMIRHHDLMVGIPIYSDLSTIHDYVVQGDGAFDETIRGILNLKKLGQKVEVRVVLHKQTYRRLPQLAEFLTRNLLFVDHIALMGLEMTGFTKANLDDLWIDPYDYQQELRAAVEHLAAFHMHVSIYNHQLCLLDPAIRPWARKSISDWKNEYMPECNGCLKREECGGFFTSARLRYSSHITPFQLNTQPEQECVASR